MVDDSSPFAHCLRAFGRQGSYVPRYGWLLKVHETLLADPLAFTREDAPTTLGVGSSMVRSMKFWAHAFGLIEASSKRKGSYRPTSRGRWLLDVDGADPYLEDFGSLWLLHWWLLTAHPCHVPSWLYLFGHTPTTRVDWEHFRRSVLRAATSRQAEALDSEKRKWTAPGAQALDRDVWAIGNMYVSREDPDSTGRRGSGLEDMLSSQFRTLGLLERNGNASVMVNRLAGRAAPDEILAYTCLDHARRTGSEGMIALPRLATDRQGPGRLLLVDSKHLHEGLRRVAYARPELGLTVLESVGQPCLAYPDGASVAAKRILDRLYPHARLRPVIDTGRMECEV